MIHLPLPYFSEALATFQGGNFLIAPLVKFRIQVVSKETLPSSDPGFGTSRCRLHLGPSCVDVSSESSDRRVRAITGRILWSQFNWTNSEQHNCGMTRLPGRSCVGPPSPPQKKASRLKKKSQCFRCQVFSFKEGKSAIG